MDPNRVTKTMQAVISGVVAILDCNVVENLLFL